MDFVSSDNLDVTLHSGTLCCPCFGMRIYSFDFSNFLSDAFEGQVDVVSCYGGRDGVWSLVPVVGKLYQRRLLVSKELLLCNSVLPPVWTSGPHPNGIFVVICRRGWCVP